MKKRAENAFQFDNSCKKAKCIFNFEIHTKKNKKRHLFGFFSFYIPYFLCILNLKIDIKRDKNEKKAKILFKFEKYAKKSRK